MEQRQAVVSGGREEGVAGEAFLQHAMAPQNLGVLPAPAVLGLGRGSCGDVIELYLRVEEGRVGAVRFMPQGCVHTIACGSALTSLIQGEPLEDAAQVAPSQVEEVLGGLPREHRHCAVVAVSALKAALRQFHEDRQSPWKSLYKRS